MSLYRKAKNKVKDFSKHISGRWLLLFGAFLGFIYILIVISSGYFLLRNTLGEESVRVGIDTRSCISGNIFFPEVYEYSTDTFEPSFSKTLSINDFVIYSDTICITPTKLLAENQQNSFILSPFGVEPLAIELTVISKPYANVIEDASVFEGGINVNAPAYFNIDSLNSLFDYVITIGDQQLICDRHNLSISCDIEKLKLEQGSEYELTFSSFFGEEEVESIIGTSIKTKTPTMVASSSLDENDLLVDLKSEIVVEFDKDIMSFDGVEILDLTSDEVVDTNVEIEGKRVKIHSINNFQKASDFELRIESVTAKDGSFLNNTYVKKFATADGPSVTSTNLLSSKFPTSSNLIITFDQVLGDSQNIREIISLSPAREYTYSIVGNQVVINPTTNFGQCEVNTVSIKPGILSNYSVSSSKSFSQSLKTSCARVGVAGYSVQGRPIYSYYFGNGPNRIIYFGAMHGSESNSATLLNNWVSELEEKYDQIPSDKTVIVVPVLNPDGYAAGTRFNSRDVDVNRNFGGSDWQSETFWSVYTYPTGGGTAPFSEPETAAIRNLIASNSPYLTLSYHSAASYVVPNSLGTSIAYAQRYSQHSGYTYIAPTTVDAFDYGITGSFGIWAQESGYPSITVELSTQYASESSRNLPAMWNMLQ